MFALCLSYAALAVGSDLFSTSSTLLLWLLDSEP